MPYFLLLYFLFFPLSVYAFVVDNCDGKPHRVTVHHPGESFDITLEPGKSRYFSGVPIELEVGTSRHFALRPNDEWCVWGKNKVVLQRRVHSPGTGGR